MANRERCAPMVAVVRAVLTHSIAPLGVLRSALGTVTCNEVIVMQGNREVRFSHLFADTLRTFGVVWSEKYYTKRGMSRSDFGLWLSIVGVL